MNAKTQNTAIAMLLFASLVLTGLLVGSLMNAQAAQAGAPAAMNQYLICAAKYKKDRDIVFVIDVLKNRMNTYTLNGTKKEIDPVPIQAAQNVDLKQMFGNGK
ncbi:MAG: hypothetical protein HZA50_18215 [Planctomycetes bacterium]|nr:hypothetical protein [Planctomycetota bacterium]